MGLPGSGKTTLANSLKLELEHHDETVIWFNADIVRNKFNDWDFSNDGRIRQAKRMRELADEYPSSYTICDFVCPLPEMREIFEADITIWMDTIKESRFEDTNQIFVFPEEYDFHITEKKSEKWARFIRKSIDSLLIFNYK
jgi:adenylylsulfate kinase